MTSLAPILQAFFTERLIGQRRASAHTINSYRDTFRLLLAYADAHLNIRPSQLRLEDLDAPFLSGFLTHLESDRGNSARTRNARLTAIRSLFRFAALRAPEQAALIARVLAIPERKTDRALVCFLTRLETQALLDSPDRDTASGRRDHALLTLAVQTGLRVSEITALGCADLVLTAGPHVRCFGKGRKERITPLTPQTAAVLRGWLAERAAQPGDLLFPGRYGGALSTDAVALLVGKQARAAALSCPSLRTKTVTPHVLRHTCAMTLLEAGVDLATIALWPRADRNHPDLSARRHGHKGTRAGADCATRNHTRSLSTLRPTARLPRRPLTMPTPRARSPCPTMRRHADSA
jgi:site-specific recombinase XerD